MNLFDLINIEFHDLPVESVNIDTFSLSIDLVVSVYNDEKNVESKRGVVTVY